MKCSFFALLCLLLISLPLKVQAQTSGEFVIKGQVMAQSEIPVHLLNYQVSIVKVKRIV